MLDWLSLLGFNGLSPIRICYKRLPYILATLVNGLADPDTEKRVTESLLNKTNVSCAQLFSWWSASVTGLTADEYRILKNFTCNLAPDNFNDYTNFYLDVSTHWRAPAKNYRSYVTTVIGDVYELAIAIGSVMHTDVKVDAPFSRAYLSSVLQELRASLEGSNRTEADHSVGTLESSVNSIVNREMDLPLVSPGQCSAGASRAVRVVRVQADRRGAVRGSASRRGELGGGQGAGRPYRYLGLRRQR